MNFESFGELASHFWRVEKSVDHAITVECDAMGYQLVAEVKARFGTYQDGWPELADATQRERERLGYTPNDPLYRSGELQGTVTHTATRHGFFVGVESGKALSNGADAAMVMGVHEFGSTRVPARPVFAASAYHMERNAHAFGLGVAIALFANRRSR